MIYGCLGFVCEVVSIVHSLKLVSPCLSGTAGVTRLSQAVSRPGGLRS